MQKMGRKKNDLKHSHRPHYMSAFCPPGSDFIFLHCNPQANILPQLFPKTLFTTANSYNQNIPLMSSNKGKQVDEGSSRSTHHHHQETPQPPSPQQPLSRYVSQKRRDWNSFGQYLRNQRPPVPLSQCNSNHVLDFLRYLDQFGKTKVHLQGCLYYGHPEPLGPCICPLRQAWGSLDALIGRLRAAYEENGTGPPESNPFASGAIRVYLREVKEFQSKARGVAYKKKKKKHKSIINDHEESSSLPLH